MQRRATKTTRGPNAAEKAFQGWVKEQPCVWCGSESGTIVDHVKGATFKHNKVLIGHSLVLSNCEICDYKKTIEGKKLGNYAAKWELLQSVYEAETGISVPIDIWRAIRGWGGTWQNG